jgi:hypothetical protein
VAYQLVENFAAGLDTRKSPLTSPAGTLTRMVNAVVSPGGEIVKRRAFVQCATVPSTTFGLAATESRLIVFGRNVDPTVPPLVADGVTVPGVTLDALKVPNAAASLSLSDYDVFDGRLYIAVHEPSVAYKHYYEDPIGTMVETEGTNKGAFIRTYQSKVYSVSGKTLYFSAINNPKLWNTGTGAGFINLSLQDADAERLTSLEVYYDKLAIFSSEAVQIWAVDADPAQNAFVQLLRAAGTTAPLSPLQYGSGDVLYLDQSGVRSLKAKDSSNSASVSDIGSPVDPTLQVIHAAQTQTYMDAAIALLEPSVGRFWMVFPTQILALSYFPGPKITAWSQFTVPFTIQHAVTCGGKIFLRDTNNNIYVYGGALGTTYDNCGVDIRLPYLDAKKPGHKKLFRAFDLTCTGTWRVAVSYEFNNPDVEETIGTFTQSTWNAGASEMQGYDSHISLRFYNETMQAATISNCAIHYDMAEDEA